MVSVADGVALLGLVLLSVGLAQFSWPAALIVLGSLLFASAALPRLLRR